jgi:tetratricopeptide (TPR) repeat protein
MMDLRKPGAALLLFAFATLYVFAQSESKAKPQSTDSLVPGLGTLHHRVTTDNSQAQAFFDQGLRLLYAFNHQDAGRSFRRATELDPQCAMAWWGVALATGPNYNDIDIGNERSKAAYEAIQKARALESGVSAAERAYIEALAQRFSSNPKAGQQKLFENYRDAMAQVAKQYPEDADAGALYAESIMDIRPWQLWSADGKPAPGTEELVRELQAVLAQHPDHPGANHFYIHAVEASLHPELALASADRLANLAPSAGHLVHMPSHIYVRVGDYPNAVLSNQKAATADEAYIHSYHPTGTYPAMYYSHNLHFLAFAATMEGNSKTALDATTRLEANIAPHLKEMPPMEWFNITRMVISVRFAKWQEIAKIPQPETRLRLTTMAWHFARGMAYAAQGQTAKAEAERKAMAKLLAAIPPDEPFGFNRVHEVMGVGLAMLDGKIASSRHDYRAAVAALEKAVKIYDALRYDEPPDWYLPPREQLGAVLLAAGKPAEAEALFRADLRQNPKNGRSLFGLAEALKAQGKLSDAADATSQFQASWKNADVQLRIEDL